MLHEIKTITRRLIPAFVILFVIQTGLWTRIIWGTSYPTEQTLLSAAGQSAIELQSFGALTQMSLPDVAAIGLAQRLPIDKYRIAQVDTRRVHYWHGGWPMKCAHWEISLEPGNGELKAKGVYSFGGPMEIVIESASTKDMYYTPYCKKWFIPLRWKIVPLAINFLFGLALSLCIVLIVRKIIDLRQSLVAKLDRFN